MASFEAEYDKLPQHKDEKCKLLTCLAVSAPGKALIIRHRSLLLIVSISATTVSRPLDSRSYLTFWLCKGCNGPRPCIFAQLLKVTVDVQFRVKRSLVLSGWIMGCSWAQFSSWDWAIYSQNDVASRFN